MTAAQFEQLDEVEVHRILQWRLKQLIRAGFAPEEATILASHVEIDLHVATGLVLRGCPPATAYRILL